MSATQRSAGRAARGVNAPLVGTGDDHRAESVGARATAEAFACEGVEVAVSRRTDRDDAGTGMFGMIVAEMDHSEFEQMVLTHPPEPHWCARAFIRSRKASGSGGRIVPIGSIAGHPPMPGSAPYGMAEAKLNSLVRNLSRELAEMRIDVNVAIPGLIATPMPQEWPDDPWKRAESMEAISWSCPGRPEEIAGLAMFLASGATGYVTGQTWTAAGGLTMNWGGA